MWLLILTVLSFNFNGIINNTYWETPILTAPGRLFINLNSTEPMNIDFYDESHLPIYYYDNLTSLCKELEIMISGKLVIESTAPINATVTYALDHQSKSSFAIGVIMFTVTLLLLLLIIVGVIAFRRYRRNSEPYAIIAETTD